MILLGVLLLVLGYLLGIGILWILGIVLLVLGAVLFVAGGAGYPVGGRRHWF